MLCIAKSMGNENEDDHDLFFHEVWLSRDQMVAREAVESDDVFFGGVGAWKHPQHVCKSSKEVEERLKIRREY